MHKTTLLDLVFTIPIIHVLRRRSSIFSEAEKNLKKIKFLLYKKHFLWYSLKVPIPPGIPAGRLRGALAQLGARLNGIQKVVGSNPICSISKRAEKWLKYVISRLFFYPVFSRGNQGGNQNTRFGRRKGPLYCQFARF